MINLRASLFLVTRSHVVSWKNGCQKFSYVYRVNITKDLPRVDRARNPVGDEKIKTLVT